MLFVLLVWLLDNWEYQWLPKSCAIIYFVHKCMMPSVWVENTQRVHYDLNSIYFKIMLKRKQLNIKWIWLYLQLETKHIETFIPFLCKTYAVSQSKKWNQSKWIRHIKPYTTHNQHETEDSFKTREAIFTRYKLFQ